jgi:hypothetical protein
MAAALSPTGRIFKELDNLQHEDESSATESQHRRVGIKKGVDVCA